MGWLSRAADALLGRRQAAAPAAAAPAETAAAAAGDLQAALRGLELPPPKPGAEHLIVMVHGLFGTRDNWTAIKGLLEEHLDCGGTLLFVSHANERQRTFEGIDTCGERLCREVHAVAAANPGLRRISFLAHSMGGLISRYAAGRLYDAGSGTIAGLQPCHFVAMATPHLGCDAGFTPAQVPLINWIAAVPAVGGAVHSVVSGLAGPVTSVALGRAGQQFFLMDAGQQQPPGSFASSSSSGGGGGSSSSSYDGGSGGDSRAEPLIVRLSRDWPEQGLLFLSALRSFETRTCYANSSGDHLVGWANSSLRRLRELPKKNGRGTGVVREDPLEAAWWPHQRPALHATPAGEQLQSGEPHTVSRQAIQQAHSAGELAAASAPADGSASQAAGSHEQQQAAAQGAPPASSSAQQQAAAQGAPGSCSSDQPLPPLQQQQQALAAAASTSAAAAEQQLEGMLARLQSMPWRRIDVCFGGTPLPLLSHQHIQMQRWWVNWPGKTTVKHLALQLQAMEQLRAQQQQQQQVAQAGAVAPPQQPSLQLQQQQAGQARKPIGTSGGSSGGGGEASGGRSSL